MAQSDATVIKVAQDGSAQYKEVQAAINSVPPDNKKRVVIEIMPGVYKQPLYIPKTKNLITLRGNHAEETVLTWDNTANKPIVHHQSLSVIGTGTYGSGTVIVEGSDFIAEGITFENSAPRGSGQAVAIRVTADRCAFYACRFLSWQDTAYLHQGNHYLRDCYIEGSVDFLFGDATTLLEHCHIHCKSEGFVTAQSRSSKDSPTGYVFLRCVITGNGQSNYAYLGRPWQPFARVVFAYTWMDACIKPEGWHNWDSPEKEGSASFYEYKCFGPGSDTSGRVKWARQLKDGEIGKYLSHSFIAPDSNVDWLEIKASIKIPVTA